LLIFERKIVLFRHYTAIILFVLWSDYLLNRRLSVTACNSLLVKSGGYEVSSACRSKLSLRSISSGAGACGRVFPPLNFFDFHFERLSD